MRHELSAFLRSRLTANTALDGVPSVEQADLTDTHTPCPLNACWNTPALMPATLTFTMCGTAPAGLLMRTPGRFCSSAHRASCSACIWAQRWGCSSSARASAACKAAARPRVGVPLR